jgi:8-oxo-dGTP diphosphatase
MIKVVAGVCIRYIDNVPHVLLGLKPDGHWEFPGGKVEPKESDSQALEREWIEELDTLIEVKEFYTSIQTYPYDVWFYKIDLTEENGDGSEAREKEHVEVTWFSLDNLNSIPMADGNELVANMLTEDYL